MPIQIVHVAKRKTSPHVMHFLVDLESPDGPDRFVRAMLNTCDDLLVSLTFITTREEGLRGLVLIRVYLPTAPAQRVELLLEYVITGLRRTQVEFHAMSRQEFENAERLRLSGDVAD